VLIDMDPAVGLDRALSRATKEERFEGFGQSLQDSMRAGFLDLATQYSDRFVVIDGARDIKTVAADVTRIVLEHLT